MNGWSLEQSRQQRADQRRKAAKEAEAAGREARGETYPLDFGTTQVELGAEFPITALEPLLGLDEEIGLVIKQAVTLATVRDDDEQQREGVQLMVDLLVMTPNLPRKLLGIAREVGDNLLGAEAMGALLASGPSAPDVASLVGAIWSWYAEALGEAFESIASSPSDGETLKQTSPGSTPDSTPAAPSSPPDTPTSSAPAA